jgi:hypothetical protein
MEVDARARAGESLLSAAAGRLAEALSAWVDEDFDRTAASAPMALELLVKAVLWKINPALLVPLDSRQEAALVALATEPRLDSPALRTIGLRAALGRLMKLRGDLPVPAPRQERLVACRNGALHVGTLPTSGANSAETVAMQVLADTLLLCNFLLPELEQAPVDFYGDRSGLVTGLLEARRSEIEHRAARKVAQAQDRLDSWQRHVDDEDLWADGASQLEAAADTAFHPDYFGHEVAAIAHDCPVCGFSGRLLGRLDVDGDVDVEHEDGGPVYYGFWVLTLHPRDFGCNVCKLRLHGPEELAICRLPSAARHVTEAELGSDFDAAEWADRLYGVRD